MKPAAFDLHPARDLAEAVALLAGHGDDARILAGGQSLMPTLNMRLSAPSLLIDINGIDTLNGIEEDGAFLRIGALTRHVEVLRSDLVRRRLPLLAAAAPHVAHMAVRNRGTFGGSIALADPAAEFPACVTALNGEIMVEGPKGPRAIPADRYFQGMYETARDADEIVTAIRLPAAAPDEVTFFQEFSRRHGDFALIGLAARASLVDGRLAEPRLVFFACGDRPEPCAALHDLLSGQAPSSALAETAARLAREAVTPMDSLHADIPTRRHLAGVLARRAVQCFAQAADHG